MIKHFLIATLFTGICNSCATQKKASGSELALLYNCWTDSREESGIETRKLIYRPCNYREFAPSRYRHRIEFKEKGEAVSLRLSPTDAHYMAPAKWSYDKEQKTVVVRDEANDTIFKFKIVELQKDLLILEKLK
jgi:hypothetical protein